MTRKLSLTLELVEATKMSKKQVCCSVIMSEYLIVRVLFLCMSAAACSLLAVEYSMTQLPVQRCLEPPALVSPKTLMWAVSSSAAAAGCLRTGSSSKWEVSLML